MSRISHSLAAKITIGVVSVGLSIFVLVAGLLFLQSRYMIRKQSREHAASVLNTALQQVRNQMNLVATAASSNAWLAEEKFDPDSLVNVAANVVRRNHHAYGCAIATEPDALSRSDRYFFTYAKMEGDSLIQVRDPEYKYYDEDWYKVPVTTGKSCWTDLNRDHAKEQVNLDRMLAIYSRPLFRQGRVVGVLSTGISFKQMAEMIYSIEYPYPDANFVLQIGDAQYLLSPDSTRQFKKTDLSGYECISAIPRTDWNLALVCPNSNVYANYYRMMLVVIIFDILGMLLIALMARWGVRHALAPIGDLVKMSDQIATGHYECTVPITRRRDAVGRMQNSFAAMQQTIMDNVASIKAATEDIEQHNEELAVATQMEKEALNRKIVFIQNVMHQIRTPLNIVQGFAQVLLEEKRKTVDDDCAEICDDEIKNITSMMKHNAVHLNRMVLMLYDSSETGTSEKLNLSREDVVSVNAVVQECIDFTKEHFPDVPVEWDTELADDVKIQTNYLYLMRSIRELVYNAAKYSDGTYVNVHVTQTDSAVVFTIEDKGSGLPEDMNFEFFTKLNAMSEGLGLGLPLTMRHVKSLGGNMIYDTTYKEGCRFIVTIPKSDFRNTILKYLNKEVG